MKLPRGGDGAAAEPDHEPRVVRVVRRLSAPNRRGDLSPLRPARPLPLGRPLRLVFAHRARQPAGAEDTGSDRDQHNCEREDDGRQPQPLPDWCFLETGGVAETSAV